MSTDIWTLEATTLRADGDVQCDFRVDHSERSMHFPLPLALVRCLTLGETYRVGFTRIPDDTFDPDLPIDIS